MALWDTGSVYSGISKSMAERMGLTPLPWKQRVDYADGESRDENVYHIHIAFPPSGRRADICAFEFRDDGQDIIIGMNIIRNGRFLLEHTDKGVEFTFTL